MALIWSPAPDAAAVNELLVEVDGLLEIVPVTVEPDAGTCVMDRLMVTFGLPSDESGMVTGCMTAWTLLTVPVRFPPDVTAGDVRAIERFSHEPESPVRLTKLPAVVAVIPVVLTLTLCVVLEVVVWILLTVHAVVFMTGALTVTAPTCVIVLLPALLAAESTTV